MSDLHPLLVADCVVLGRLPLCHLLLMNDSNYPWFILVPARADIREIYQLDAADRQQLLDESCELSEFLMEAYAGEKLNVAALGNYYFIAGPCMHSQSNLVAHHPAGYENSGFFAEDLRGAGVVAAGEVALAGEHLAAERDLEAHALQTPDPSMK